MGLNAVGADAVGAELVAFGRELAAAGDAQVGDAFTDNPEADALIKTDPNAFLVGVLFTQGIPAERAWAGPWGLRERLGHLNLSRMASEEEAVAAAVATRPALHRFKLTLPRYISGTASLLLEQYDGDASRVWPVGDSVVDVTERLKRFPGIGHKKAVMAVELLVRHFGVDLAGVEDGNVAYDVQVRRVFLRSGLVGEDSLPEVEAAARRVSPEAPGLLDLPTWLVGREWCRPKAPRCDACRLGAVCPRLVGLDVPGVGVRARGDRQG